MFKSIGNSPELSSSKKNDAYDANIEFYTDGYWVILFEAEAGVMYEVQLEYDLDCHQPTLHPIKAITWLDDVIDDVQTVEIKVKYT
jgi:hypothetical protein